jgi:hypothetical protein
MSHAHVAVWLLIAELAACASTPPVAAPVPPPGAGSTTTLDGGTTILGPILGDGCFHVTHIEASRYSFVLDNVKYPAALGAGQVEIAVRAVSIGALVPQPRALPRLPRLKFLAEGEAQGAFEVSLTLVDGEGHRSETTQFHTICDDL